MEVQWNGELGETFINETIGSQTFHMAFQEEQYNMDTVYINVYMTLYNKRTQIEANESAVRSTGLNPMRTITTAIKAFNMLEADAIMTHCRSNNMVIYCTWLDNRRRDAYYHFLSRKGYRYGFTPDEHKKCIMKKYKRGTTI